MGDRNRKDGDSPDGGRCAYFDPSRGGQGVRTTSLEIISRILYGGSVKPDNATALMAESEIDGALVGGASLDPKSFAAIVKY